MAFCIYREINELKYKYTDTAKPYVSMLVRNKERISIGCGEFYSELKVAVQNDGSSRKNQYFEHALTIITAEKQSKNITVMNSVSGLVPIYYYCSGNGRFCIEDNFWDVIDYINPDETDMDINSIKEHMSIPFPLYDNTFVKKMKVLLPNTKLIYDFGKDSISLEELFDYEYDESNAAVPLSEILDSAYKRIDCLVKKIYAECGDITYGVGISGGLDSRIIPHFCKKNGLKIAGFIFGIKRPNWLFLSQDHRNAGKIADYYEFKMTEVKWTNRNLSKRILEEIKYFPMGSAEFFKYEPIDDFDVLIHGGNGYVVGSSLPENIESMTENELVDSIRKLGLIFYPNSLFNLRVEKIVRFLTNRDKKIERRPEWFDKVIFPDIEKNIIDKLQEYVKSEKLKGKSNVYIFERYFHYQLGCKNKFGAFESLNGNKRSFSIYMPYLFGDTLSWGLDCFKGRKFLKKFILTYIPELGNIEEQNYKGNIKAKRSGTISKIINLGKFAVRGNGTSAVEVRYFKKNISAFKATMNNGTVWFYNIFNIENYIDAIAKFDNTRVASRLWKLKMVIDIIEKKEYKSMIMNIEEEKV